MGRKKKNQQHTKKTPKTPKSAELSIMLTNGADSHSGVMVSIPISPQARNRLLLAVGSQAKL